MTAVKVPSAMTIAGSDSGGGAGIQADLKTFAAFGVFGTCAITAITAQNTVAVTAVEELPPEIVAAQIDAIYEDIGADAVKTGMLATAGIVNVVAERIDLHRLPQVVVDPVMVSTTGARLLRDDAVHAYKSRLLPRALVVTPNIPEAEALSGITVRSLDAMREAARFIAGLGPRHVIVKGGHLDTPECVDILFDGRDFLDFPGERLRTTSNHGTGCTFASAIAAGLARNRPMPEAVAAAKQYVTESMRAAFPAGRGHGPLNHLHEWWARLPAR